VCSSDLNKKLSLINTIHIKSINKVTKIYNLIIGSFI